MNEGNYMELKIENLLRKEALQKRYFNNDFIISIVLESENNSRI